MRLASQPAKTVSGQWRYGHSLTDKLDEIIGPEDRLWRWVHKPLVRLWRSAPCA